jgi:phenylalanyl-tRNA synthetase beta chain
MRVSKRQLSQFLGPAFQKLTTSDLVDILNPLGLSVAGVTPVFQGSGLEKVVVAQVTAWQKHPNADRLRLCTVSLGPQDRKIVCGADNFSTGDWVPLALPGAQLPGGLLIRESKIRGEDSQGMICSLEELGLGHLKDTPEAKGIWNLSQEGFNLSWLESQKGRALGKSLDLEDEVIELELTPNRGDCACYLGVAREISAATGILLNNPFDGPKAGASRVLGPKVKTLAQAKDMSVSITSSAKLTPTFVLQVWKQLWDPQFRTPFEIKFRLGLHGTRSIHPLVDIGNWVMLECGQPLHVYDCDKIEGTLVVREATAGEKGTTLMGEERIFRGGETVIADDRKLLCVGGVVGMKQAEVGGHTRRFWVEGAHFDPVSIRKTVSRLEIQTEASYRFERGVDPRLPVRALKRFEFYLNHYYGWAQKPDLVALRQTLPKPTTIASSVQEIQTWVRDVTRERIVSSLKKLGFGIRGTQTLNVTPPSHRFDVDGSADLAEEVARLFGYENISDDDVVNLRLHKPTQLKAQSQWKRRFHLSDTLVGQGYCETVHVGFLSKDAWSQDFASWVSPEQWVAVSNPINRERGYLPPTMVPLLLEQFLTLRDRGQEVIKIFELGRTFLLNPKSLGQPAFGEEQVLTLLTTHSHHRDLSAWEDAVWNTRSFTPRFGLFQFLAEIKLAMESLGFPHWQVKTMVPKALASSLIHPGVYLEWAVKDHKVGWVGQIHPAHPFMRRAQHLHCYVAEINLSHLSRLQPIYPTLDIPSAFPKMNRDVSLRLLRPLSFAEVLEGFHRHKPEKCRLIQLLDHFSENGGPVSLTFRMVYEDRERTLSDEEVNAWQEKFRLSLKQELPIEYK